MDSDIKFNTKILDNFLLHAKMIKDFVILAPQHEKSKYKKEFLSLRENKFKKLLLMKMVHGHFLFFNMENVRKVGLYDEKIFLYFDETDFCLRAYRKNHKIYVIPKIVVKHEGGRSVDINNKLNIDANKNWHFMWSKFYFYKKNYSLLRGYKETIYDLFKIVINLLVFYFIDKRKKVIYLNQLSGLFNSYLGNKSLNRLKNN